MRADAMLNAYIPIEDKRTGPCTRSLARAAGPGTGRLRERISIIIPVLNEVEIIGAALETLLQQPGDYEVIVADGGSTDGTCEVVQHFPVRFVGQPPTMPPGLGFQINRGADKARGNILAFLHIDVQLPLRGMALIETALANPRYIGGGFIPTYHGQVPETERLRLALVQNRLEELLRIGPLLLVASRSA